MSFEETKESKVKSTSASTKKTFYCSVCKISLNSQATRVIHEKGARHTKNVLRSEVDDGVIFPKANPESRKKIPIKLGQKIKDTPGQYIVGLDSITEYIPVSDDEMEPHYRCGLCDSKGQSNCMFSHLTGRNHRLKFAGSIFGEEAVLDATPAELAQIARDHDESGESGFEMRIKTIRSDEEYPWPSAKAPWLIENGGTGIAPQMSERKAEVKPPLGAAAADSERKEEEETNWRKIKPSQVRPPSSSEEAVKMMMLAKRMLELGLEARGASSTDINIVKISTGLALNSLL